MKNKINICFWWLFWILYLEFIYRLFIIKNFLLVNCLYTILFNIPIICILTLLTTCFNERTNKVISYIFTFLVTIFTLAQIVYFRFYNSIFSFFSLTTGTRQVMAFYEIIIKIILNNWYIFILVLFPLILYYFFSKRKLILYGKILIKQLACAFSVLALSLITIFFCIFSNERETYSIYNLLYNIHAPMIMVNKIGLNSMELIDVYRYTFGFEEKIVTGTELNQKEYSSKEYNIYDIDFNSLIDNENNEKIKDIHRYINSSEATNKNEYSGIFKNKNLIFITAESFDTISINKEITPTLYKMVNNSYVFNNYYQPLFPISTTDGEYMNLNSLIPKEGTWSFSSSSNNNMKFSIGNMFKNEGYNAYAFHNNDYTFYERSLSHENIGFKFLGCGNGLEKLMNCENWPSSDYEMIKSTLPLYINDAKFITYYMTVSGHLSYSYLNNSIAIKNRELVENLPYPSSIKAFYATQIELDKALEYLISELERNNKLNDTIIILCPDHYPYGLLKSELNIVSNIDRTDKFENYHTSLIVYNLDISNTQIDDTISGLDILPTIYNLFGIKYDSRFYMGKDIFSDSDHIVILSDRSWITKKGKYDSISNKFYSFTNDIVSNDYIDKINDEVYKKFAFSSLILDENYYSKIGD